MDNKIDVLKYSVRKYQVYSVIYKDEADKIFDNCSLPLKSLILVSINKAHFIYWKMK